MLAMIRPPSGGEWGPTLMKRLTGERIGISYFNSLRDGHVDIPRADKLEAIAEAMGFPPELWFKDLDWWQRAYNLWEKGEDPSSFLSGDDSQALQIRISRRLNQLFDLKPDPETGAPFSNHRVAKLSNGVLTTARVEELRAGTFSDVSREELKVLCAVFEVRPTYWSEESSVPWRVSPEGLSELMDADSFETMQNSMTLSRDNRGMLRRMSEYLKRDQESGKSA